jgi:hypothetical protein
MAGLFPAGLLVGQVIATTDGRLRARLAADLVRLQFLRVMRSHPGTSLDDPGNLIGPPWPFPEEVDEPPRLDGRNPERSAPRQQQRGRAMSSAHIHRHIWTYRGDLCLVCGVDHPRAAVAAGPGRKRPAGPDLLLAVTFAWLLRQPAVVPYRVDRDRVPAGRLPVPTPTGACGRRLWLWPPKASVAAACR